MASATIIELDDTNTCKICENALAKYSCPKCNVLYCSLICYQNTTHLQCSENFYKENVLEELAQSQITADSKAKMEEILQRTHENNRIPSDDEWEDVEDECEGNPPFSQFVDIDDLTDLDSDDEVNFNDLGERLATICLDDADDVWDKLTADEKQGFMSFLKTEDVGKYINLWKPWWVVHFDDKIVDVNDNSLETHKKTCPTLVDIQELSNITTKPPAECVKFNLVNLLAAYAFTTRYFNGEHYDFTQEAIACVASISLALSKNQNFEDFETAVKSVELECANNNWLMADKENMEVMDNDLKEILQGPRESEKNFYVLCALSDLHQLAMDCLLKTSDDGEKGQSEFNKAFPNEFPEVQEEPRKNIKVYVKKIEYFLSFAKECYDF